LGTKEEDEQGRWLGFIFWGHDQELGWFNQGIGTGCVLGDWERKIKEKLKGQGAREKEKVQRGTGRTIRARMERKNLS